MANPKATKERILDEAIAIANAEGLESLSVRAVAKRLELSPGNVSYHFSRKLDLILGISERLSAGNTASYAEPLPARLPEMLERYRRIFERQHGFRGMILSAPHAMEAYPELRTRYRRIEKERRQQGREQIEALRAAGQLELDDDAIDRLVHHISLTARFWMHDYRMSRYRNALGNVIDHYLAMLADLFQPYATEAGRADLAPYLEGFLQVPPRTEESVTPPPL